MKVQPIHAGITLILGILLGIVFTKLLTRYPKGYEGFSSNGTLSKRDKVAEGFLGDEEDRRPKPPNCGGCRKPWPCGCPSPRPICPPCREPDLSKYVLKSTIPPCPQIPDMTNYMLKTECPPVPDLSKYVLKSSVPKPQPVILDCSKCAKNNGQCAPCVCPRPKYPEVRCPIVKCDPPRPCPRPPPCPAPVVKCKTEEPVQSVRPFLAPLSTMGFGLS